MKNRFSSTDGQTLVEFVLIFILLLAVVFGIIEFALISFDKVMITHASREAAREGVLFRVDPVTYDYSPLTDTEIKNAVNDSIQNNLVTFGAPFDANTDVTASWSADGGSTWTSTLPTEAGTGEMLRVEVRFSYSYLLLPNFLNFGGSTLNLTSSSTMRME